MRVMRVMRAISYFFAIFLIVCASLFFNLSKDRNRGIWNTRSANNRKQLELLEPLKSTTEPPDMFEKRVKVVKDFCSSKIDRKGSAIGNLLVLKERNLVWCPVYKAGSSTWMKYLVHLSLKSPKEKEQLFARDPYATIGMKKCNIKSSVKVKH